MILKKILASGLVIGCFAFNVNEDFISIVKSKAGSYFNKIDRVKLELIFNQPTYIPGDTVVLKGIYLRASDLKPVSGTQVVHISLFDQNGSKKMTRYFTIMNGVSVNKMVIPQDLIPGRYVLLAFTEWMKNLDQSLFFKTDFVIAGKNLTKKIQHDTIEFYPEGGKLIAGIENNIAVRYTGENGKVIVSVKTPEGERTQLQLKKDSVTILKIIPDYGQKYYAEFSGKKFALPKLYERGITISSTISNEKAHVYFRKTANIQPTEIHLLIFNSSGLAHQAKVDFDNNGFAELILPRTLPRGIIQLILADSNFETLAERVFTLEPAASASIDLPNLKTIYNTREAVTTDLQLKGLDGSQKNGSYFLRILNADLFQKEDQFMDYLTFRSDISGTFQLKRNSANIISINNYLITQTCPWFNWKKIMESNLALKYNREEYMTFSGQASYVKNNQPVRDSTLLMFYLVKNLIGYEAYTNSKGKFAFPLVLNINSNDQFFFTSSYKGKDGEEIKVKVQDLDSMITVDPDEFPVSAVENSVDPYFVYQTKRQSINDSYVFFGGQKALQDSTFDANKPLEDELNGPDATVKLTDFLQMPSMEEVLKEIVRAVEYRKINGRHVVRVYTTAKRPNNYTGPLYVIDGQLTKNPELLLSLKPAEVINLKLFKDSRKLFTMGQLGSNGVIMIKTKKYLRINEPSMIDFTGLLPKAEETPSNQINSNFPRIQACIFWSAKGRLNDMGSTRLNFMTTDDTGKFVMQIVGITDDGYPIYAEHPFEVKYSGN